MSANTPPGPHDDGYDDDIDDLSVDGFDADIPSGDLDNDPDGVVISEDLHSPTAQEIDREALGESSSRRNKKDVAADRDIDLAGLDTQDLISGPLADTSISGSRERVGSKKWYVLGGIACFVVGVAYLLASTRSTPQVAVPVRTGEAMRQQTITATGLSHTDRSLRFISEALRDMTEQVGELSESAQLLAERQDTVEERFTRRMERGLRESADVIQSTLDTLQRASIQRASRAASQERIFEWRRRLATDRQGALQAIPNFRSDMQGLNIAADEIDDIIAEALEDYGIILLDNLAEPPLRERDTRELAPHLAPYIIPIRDALYTHAFSSGEVLRSDGLETIALRTYARLAGRDLARDELETIWPFVRVRRESLTARHKSQMPSLFGQLPTAVPDRNPYGVQTFVWRVRDTLRPLSPGQQLSIIQVLTRAVGNVPGLGETDRRPFSEQAREFAAQVIRDAVASGRARGLSSLSELRGAAESAFREYIDMARINISRSDFANFLDATVRNSLRESGPSSRTEDPLRWRIQQLIMEGRVDYPESGQVAQRPSAPTTADRPTRQQQPDIGDAIGDLLQRMTESHTDERGRLSDSSGVIHAVASPDGAVYDLSGEVIGTLDGLLFTHVGGRTARLREGPPRPGQQSARPVTRGVIAQETGEPLRMGTIEASLDQTMLAGYILTAVLADTLPVSRDPSDVAYVTSLTAAWSQVPRLTTAPFVEFSGASEGGAQWGEIMAPQLIEVLQASTGFRRFPVVPRIDPMAPHFQLMRGIILGNTYGPIVREPEMAEEATAAAQARWGDWAPAAPAIDAFTSLPPGVGQILAVQDAMGFRHLPSGPAPMATYIAVSRTAIEMLNDVISSLPDPSSWGSQSRGLRDVARSAILAFTPLATASYAELWEEPDQMESMVITEGLRYLAGVVAIDKVYQEVNNRMLPRYSASLPDRGQSLNRLAQMVTRVVPELVFRRLSRVPELQPGRIMVTADAVAADVVAQVERGIVADVVMTRAEPRVRRIGELDGESHVQQLLREGRRHADRIIRPSYTPARIDQWISEVVAHVQRHHDGVSEDDGSSGAADSVAPQIVLAFPPPRSISGSGGQVFGDPRVMISRPDGAAGGVRRITIPAGSYGNAHILNGVNAEIGGDAGDGVLLNFTYEWKGPNNSRLIMRNLRLMASATPSPGTQRIRLNLENLSYVFESGHSIFQGISGYVVDDQDSLSGVPGTLDLNIGRVMPWTVATGATQGFGEAIRSIVESEIQAEQLASQAAISAGNAATSSTRTQTGEIIRRSALIGAADGVGTVGSYLDRVVADIRPSIRVPNGRSVTVVLSQPVVFDVPEEEFKSLLSTPGGL